MDPDGSGQKKSCLWGMLVGIFRRLTVGPAISDDTSSYEEEEEEEEEVEEEEDESDQSTRAESSELRPTSPPPPSPQRFDDGDAKMEPAEESKGGTYHEDGEEELQKDNEGDWDREGYQEEEEMWREVEKDEGGWDRQGYLDHYNGYCESWDSYLPPNGEEAMGEWGHGEETQSSRHSEQSVRVESSELRPAFPLPPSPQRFDDDTTTEPVGQSTEDIPYLVAMAGPSQQHFETPPPSPLFGTTPMFEDLQAEHFALYNMLYNQYVVSGQVGGAGVGCRGRLPLRRTSLSSSRLELGPTMTPIQEEEEEEEDESSSNGQCYPDYDSYTQSDASDVDSISSPGGEESMGDEGVGALRSRKSESTSTGASERRPASPPPPSPQRFDDGDAKMEPAEEFKGGTYHEDGEEQLQKDNEGDWDRQGYQEEEAEMWREVEKDNEGGWDRQGYLDHYNGYCESWDSYLPPNGEEAMGEWGHGEETQSSRNSEQSVRAESSELRPAFPLPPSPQRFDDDTTTEPVGQSTEDIPYLVAMAGPSQQHFETPPPSPLFEEKTGLKEEQAVCSAFSRSMPAPSSASASAKAFSSADWEKQVVDFRSKLSASVGGTGSRKEFSVEELVATFNCDWPKTPLEEYCAAFGFRTLLKLLEWERLEDVIEVKYTPWHHCLIRARVNERNSRALALINKTNEEMEKREQAAKERRLARGEMMAQSNRAKQQRQWMSLWQRVTQENSHRQQRAPPPSYWTPVGAGKTGRQQKEQRQTPTPAAPAGSVPPRKSASMLEWEAKRLQQRNQTFVHRSYSEAGYQPSLQTPRPNQGIKSYIRVVRSCSDQRAQSFHFSAPGPRQRPHSLRETETPRVVVPSSGGRKGFTPAVESESCESWTNVRRVNTTERQGAQFNPRGSQQPAFNEHDTESRYRQAFSALTGQLSDEQSVNKPPGQQWTYNGVEADW